MERRNARWSQRPRTSSPGRLVEYSLFLRCYTKDCPEVLLVVVDPESGEVGFHRRVEEFGWSLGRGETSIGGLPRSGYLPLCNTCWNREMGFSPPLATASEARTVRDTQEKGKPHA